MSRYRACRFILASVLVAFGVGQSSIDLPWAVLRPSVDFLYVADPPAVWEALGFTVADGVVPVGGVRLRLGATGSGIVGWSLRGWAGEDLGVPTRESSDAEPAPPVAHPNGAVAVDHIVAVTPSFAATVAALTAAGLDHRRTVEARQAFF